MTPRPSSSNDRFTAGAAGHIDELGHVNNAVWVQWIQQVAVAHWEALADAAHKDAYFWVVVRHEIDYLRPALEGDVVTARTWIGGCAKGRSVRAADGVHRRRRENLRSGSELSGRSSTRRSGRPIRVPREVVAPFLAAE